MKVFNLSIMLRVHLNYLLLLLSVLASVCSYPSVTLSEKNKEVSWEAWLLVDDQNQNRQQLQEGQIPRRRITAKSVFVAPTFSPENLPPCAEGYNSDSLGRCVKIIKLDEDKHLDFLVNKLNEKFGSSIDYESALEIDESNSQPTKLDIPFIPEYEDYYSNDTPQEELDMAIIVTPTTRETDKTKDDDSSKVGKRDDKADENVYEQELKKLAKTSSTIKYDDETEQTTITIESNTATEITSTEFDSTTTMATTTMGEEEEEISTIKDDEELTTTVETTTEVPTRKSTTTAPKITTYHPIATTYHPYFDLEVLGNSRTRNLVKFPDEVGAVPRSHPDGNFVKFPDIDYKHQQESLIHHTRDVDEQSGNYFNEIVTPQPSQRIHEMVLPPKGELKGYFTGFNLNYRNSEGFHPKFLPSKADSVKFFPHQMATTERHTIKKHNGPFVLPPKWSSEEHHKPIVLRFSRKHFNLDTNKFKNSEFYRSLPMDDLTYLFGYKHGQTTHR